MRTAKMKQYVQSLKPGDEVFVSNGIEVTSDWARSVSRVEIQTWWGYRFSPKVGLGMNGQCRIVHPDPVEEEKERLELLHGIKGWCKSASLEKLRKVAQFCRTLEKGQ